ncbi:MAG TPA: biopolymer transporter ExbD [Gemmataceae bacterium]|jgi:biopolymer transport protein ExbD
MSKKKRKEEAPVEPDLPITPMLDMSFQLMAFFIFTFRPAPTEGQIAMSLPTSEGAKDSQAIPDPTDEKPEVFVVRVEAADNGTIARMSITQKDAVDTRAEDLGADVRAYEKTLRTRYNELKGDKAKAKVSLEMADNLLNEYVVQLLDLGMQAGFKNIAPAPFSKR